MLERLLFLSPAGARRPFLACEVSPFGVIAARQHEGAAMVTHFVPLAPGAVYPGVKAPNLAERASVVSALRTALGEVADRERNTTLILPDGAVRVLLIDFDTLPAKEQDVLPIIRFRLRKLVPFEVEGAAISYQVMPKLPVSGAVPGAPIPTRVLVTVTPKDVLRAYESAVREAGYEPGVVLSSTLAAAALLPAEPALVVNHNGNTLTTAIVRGDELLLHRSLEFEGEEPAGVPSADSSFIAHDLRQNVSVAVAYFEDTLAAQPSSVYYIGPGSTAKFAELLDDTSLEVRNLVPEAALPARTLPASLLGPVAGALTSS